MKRIAIALGATIVITSAVLALYHRPWGSGFWMGTHPARVGMHLSLATTAARVHAVAGYGAAVVLGLVWARWLRRRLRRNPATGPGHGGEPQIADRCGPCLTIAFAAVLLVVASARVVPWQDSLPWSPRPALHPVLLESTEGPFPRLVGIAAVYDTGEILTDSRFVTVVAAAHALVPVILSLVVAVIARRRRRS